MSQEITQIFDRISAYILCMIVPGILISIGGIRSIIRKKIITVGTNSSLHWKKPTLIIGNEAVKEGGCSLIFGISVIIFGIILIIGQLQ